MNEKTNFPTRRRSLLERLIPNRKRSLRAQTSKSYDNVFEEANREISQNKVKQRRATSDSVENLHVQPRPSRKSSLFRHFQRNDHVDSHQDMNVVHRHSVTVSTYLRIYLF